MVFLMVQSRGYTIVTRESPCITKHHHFTLSWFFFSGVLTRSRQEVCHTTKPVSKGTETQKGKEETRRGRVFHAFTTVISRVSIFLFWSSCSRPSNKGDMRDGLFSTIKGKEWKRKNGKRKGKERNNTYLVTVQQQAGIASLSIRNGVFFFSKSFQEMRPLVESIFKR